MQFTVTREYQFAAGHHLPQVRSPHPCAKPHGHTYIVKVSLSARDIDSDGFVRDDCSKIDNVIARLEGSDLCDMIAPEFTTTECLAAILYTVFRKLYPEIGRVAVSDRKDRWVWYEGPMPPNWARQCATSMIVMLQLPDLPIAKPDE